MKLSLPSAFDFALLVDAPVPAVVVVVVVIVGVIACTVVAR